MTQLCVCVCVVYKSSSECYRRVMSEGRLDNCNSQWTQLGHVMHNVSAYQFYCQHSDTKRRHLIASVSTYLLAIILDYILTKWPKLTWEEAVTPSLVADPVTAEVHSRSTVFAR